MHDIRKPMFQIRLEDLDPSRHELIIDCCHCGFVQNIDIKQKIADKGDSLIRWVATMDNCPKCGKRPQNYEVRMKGA